MQRPTARRYSRGLALLIVALGLLSLLPGAPIMAQGTPEAVDNTQGEFANGIFQRTSIGAGTSPVSSIPADLSGLVQLAPAGVLNQWENVNTEIPALSEAGVAAIGKRLFVVGGAITGGSYSPNLYWATVNQVDGSFVETSAGSGKFWTAVALKSDESPIDPINLDPGCLGTGPRKAAGVAALTTDAANSAGFIYVVGGQVDPSGCVSGFNNDLTASYIQRATVAANGSITWNTTAMPRVPSPRLPDNASFPIGVNQYGVQNAGVQIVTTSAGKNYLYIFGGKHVVYNQFGILSERTLKAVFYTEINASGNFVHPSTGSTSDVWARNGNVNSGDIPVPAGKAGLWGATLINTGQDALFVAGGAYDLPADDLNPYVYRADINATTGALTWNTAPSDSGAPAVSMGVARTQLTGLSFNNKLYLIGGQTSKNKSDAKHSVPVGFFDDNVDLMDLNYGSNDFFAGTADSDQVLALGGRAGANAALILATPPAGATNDEQNAAWVYVVGGSSPANDVENSIHRGAIGGANESSSTKRAPSGWYYSSPVSTLIDGKQARITALQWVASGIDQITRQDIKIEYRVTVGATDQCAVSTFKIPSNPSDPTDPNYSDRWREIDGDPDSDLFSKNTAAGAEFNTVGFASTGPEKIVATCLQYRAKLIQGTGDATQTPKLYGFYLKKVRDGDVDLKLEKLEAQVNSKNLLTGITVQVKNLNTDLKDTLSVSESLPPPQNDGNFFVNLCVAAGSTLNLPAIPAQSGTNPTCSVAYARIRNPDMTAGATISLPWTTSWYTYANNVESRVDLCQIFATPGTYTIGVIIDYQNLIPESATGKLNNRGEDASHPNGYTQTFTTSGCGFSVAMPMLRK